MKRFMRVSTAVLIFLAFAQAAYAGAGLQKIADGVYSYLDGKDMSPAGSFAVNTAIVVGADGVLVIDTMTSAKAARGFISDIRAITDKPIKYVVDTHSHLDHALGNGEFVKLGAVVIAQENARQGMKSLEGILEHPEVMGMTKDDLAGTTVAYPAVTFTERMTLDMGTETVELIYMGHTHSADSIVVWLPKSRILFAGDALFTNVHPFLGEGDITLWQGALDALADMGAEKIVPGHGPLSTKKDLADMKEYLGKFDQKARQLCAQSSDIGKITAAMLEYLPRRPLGEGLVAFSLSMKYLKPSPAGQQ